MIALAAGVVWLGYGMASYGWVLIRGYDITAVAWWSPLHPYTWPADGDPGFVRRGQVFPGGAPGTSSTTTSTGTGGSTGSGSGSGSGGKGMPNGPAGGRGKVLGA